MKFGIDVYSKNLIKVREETDLLLANKMEKRSRFGMEAVGDSPPVSFKKRFGMEGLTASKLLDCSLRVASSTWDCMNVCCLIC